MKKSKIVEVMATLVGILAGITFALFLCAIDALDEAQIICAFASIGALMAIAWSLSRFKERLEFREWKTLEERRRRAERIKKLDDAA